MSPISSCQKRSPDHPLAKLGIKLNIKTYEPGTYINQINNSPTDETTSSYYEINNNWIHELRGTVRYRFN